MAMNRTSPSSNVIEFDSSRLKLAGMLRPRGEHSPTADVAELQRRLNLELQTSLEPEHLLGLFLARLGMALPVVGLGFRHEPTDLQLELGDAGVHSLHYRLQHDGENLGDLLLHLASNPLGQTLAPLDGWLGCLLYPLRNALLYRAALLDALRDPLTGAGNRVAMNRALSREIELARRHGQPLSLIMLDIDHFKQVNDRFGHHCGDQVLKAVSTCIRAQLRNVDMLFRYGGEEFLILLSNTGEDAAERVGQRLCGAVEAMRFDTEEGMVLPLSVSLGCASYRLSEDVDTLLKRADAALYQAKRNGRNQLRMAI